MNVDRLLAEFTEPEVMTLYYAGGITGRDKDGNIIRVDPSGRNDVKGGHIISHLGPSVDYVHS